MTIIAIIGLTWHGDAVASVASDENALGAAGTYASTRFTCGDIFAGTSQVSGIFEEGIGVQNTVTGVKRTRIRVGECLSGLMVDDIGPGWCTYKNGQRRGSNGGWVALRRDPQGCLGTAHPRTPRWDP